LCEDDDYDFWFDVEELYHRPKCELEDIITTKRWIELKDRFIREPWGSKARNMQHQSTIHLLNMIASQKMCKDPDFEEKFRLSKTSQIKDEIKDKLLDPDTGEYEFAHDSLEAMNYQQILMAKASIHGVSKRG
jgi:hypothetical protein